MARWKVQNRILERVGFGVGSQERWSAISEQRLEVLVSNVAEKAAHYDFLGIHSPSGLERWLGDRDECFSWSNSTKFSQIVYTSI